MCICHRCNSADVKKSFISGNKIGNIIVILLMIGVIQQGYLGKNLNPSISIASNLTILISVVIIALAVIGFFLPKYKCRNCGNRFS